MVKAVSVELEKVRVEVYALKNDAREQNAYKTRGS